MRQTIICMLGVLIVACQAHEADALTLTANGKAATTIVIARDASEAEQTAAAELAHYLGQITGSEFAVRRESETLQAGSHIYVGLSTVPSAPQDKLAPEEWVVRSVGNDVFIIGGSPRGTLYGVYHFLEDVCGVHWWSPWEESVPQHKTLKVGKLNLHGKPVIRYRDIYYLMLYSNNGRRFAARNRLDLQGEDDAPNVREFGGERHYGPPYPCHTFNRYFPPEQYSKEHPEWYALIDGKRTFENSQLCLTNDELRKAFLAKLIDYIETSSRQARENGLTPPDVFSVSKNDFGSMGACQCDKCQALAKAEESETGPLLDFVNYMADGIKEKYPRVYVETLASWHLQKPPKTIRPRDNVIIRLADHSSNFTLPITDPGNEDFRERLESWAKITGHLRIWNYGVTFAPYYGLPLPTVQTYPVNYRYYAEHHVEGVFNHHEYLILADMRDFKVWMTMKLLENPYADYDRLVRTFTDGFYGPAGKCVRDYLADLEAAARARPSYLSMYPSPTQYNYLTLDFVLKAQKTFDKAEKAAGADPVLRRRLRHARLSLDRAAVILYPRLLAAWLQTGQPLEKMPLDRDQVAERYRATWYEQADLRLPANERAAEKAVAEAEVKNLTARQAYFPLPEQFRNLPPGSVFDYPADSIRNWQDPVKVVPDATTESGLTYYLELSDKDMERYKLPMAWGSYDAVTKVRQDGSVIYHQIGPQDVPGPGYHWYKMGSPAITPTTYLFFFWNWAIQVDVGNAADPANPRGKFDVWTNIKFTGPGFPHGQAGEKNAIWVERVILVKAK